MCELVKGEFRYPPLKGSVGCFNSCRQLDILILCTRIKREGKSEITEITDELLDVRLERIVVYADKTIELRWKFDNSNN